MNSASKLEALRAEVAALEQAEMTAAKDAAKAKSEAWNAFVASDPWEFQCSPKMYQSWGNGKGLYTNQIQPCTYPKNWNGTRGYEVPACYVGRAFDLQKLEAWETIWGTAPQGRTPKGEREWVGMTYLRTDEGILNHESGGTYVLRTPMLCSDAEWVAICEGRIPLKFVY